MSVTVTTKAALLWSLLASCAAKSPASRRNLLARARSVAFVPRANLSKTSLSSSNMFLAKHHSPSAERNKDPIWNVLKEQINLLKLTDGGKEKLQILEVAAGSGVHTAYFVSQLGQEGQYFSWQSSDPDQEARESQKAYIQEDVPVEFQALVSPEPLCLTLDNRGIVEAETEALIPAHSLHIIMNINMIHISPWSATEGLMKMAGEKLKTGGILYLYGPYKVDGTAVASNLKFDQFLKAKDPGYGVRNLEDVVALAELQGLKVVGTVEMPANNLSVIFRSKRVPPTGSL